MKDEIARVAGVNRGERGREGESGERMLRMEMRASHRLSCDSETHSNITIKIT